jgi:threonine/homoserine/homoserine lactone efflux protein
VAIIFTLPGATLVQGLILGWSVGWPPGPINAEMIRRGLLPERDGGGFWSAWRVGLGACTGDFIWALAVSAGAGALINTPTIRSVLAVVSFFLLLFLAGVFTRGAWRIARHHRAATELGAEAIPANQARASHGYLLGLTVALTSPWNIGFWLAVVGSQSQQATGRFADSILLAAAVVLGAITWGCVLCIAVKLGSRIFSHPVWQVATQALSALVMLYFAARLLLQFR